MTTKLVLKGRITFLLNIMTAAFNNFCVVYDSIYSKGVPKYPALLIAEYIKLKKQMAGCISQIPRGYYPRRGGEGGCLDSSIESAYHSGVCSAIWVTGPHNSYN